MEKGGYYVERCLDGHPDDFRHLVRRYQLILLAHLAGKLGSRDRAEEAAQENPDGSVERLRESVIGGPKAAGYRMIEKGGETTIWVDAESLLPLQVEHVIGEATGPPIRVVMMDIEFDVPLDRRDFSIEIPDGYTARTMQADASRSTEADLVAMLAFYAEKTDGEFPSTLGWMLFKDFGKCWGAGEVWRHHHAGLLVSPGMLGDLSRDLCRSVGPRCHGRDSGHVRGRLGSVGECWHEFAYRSRIVGARRCE